MRIVIQRVQEAAVHVDETVIGEIKHGLLVFVGIEAEDDHEDREWIIRKLLNQRIFEDESGNMNLSVSDIHGELLVVSQFTLYASTKKGNRPSFMKAAPPDFAAPFLQI